MIVAPVPAQAPEEAPWLAEPAEVLRRARAAGRFPSALLIHGALGAGGAVLAEYAARVALCSGAQPPCGQCADCRRLAAGTHPDRMRVAPAADARQIRIEQIRELCEALALTAHGGRATVASIEPADAMNANAANALLKTLEEPRAGVSLILLAATPSRLSATLVSRCRRLRIPTPARADSLAWLERRRGPGPWDAVLDVIGEAPFEALAVEPRQLLQLARDTRDALQALDRGTDIGRLADGWMRSDGQEWRLACIETWLTSRIEAKWRAQGGTREMRSGAHLSEGGSELNMRRLLRALDGLQELRRLRHTSINRALALEQLLWLLARG